MAEQLTRHPILTYLTFILPAVLLALGIVFGASVLLIIMTLTWLGVAFVVLFLPISKDNGSAS